MQSYFRPNLKEKLSERDIHCGPATFAVHCYKQVANCPTAIVTDGHEQFSLSQWFPQTVISYGHLSDGC